MLIMDLLVKKKWDAIGFVLLMHELHTIFVSMYANNLLRCCAYYYITSPLKPSLFSFIIRRVFLFTCAGNIIYMVK